MADTAQTITIIVSILVPMLGGFGWIIHQIGVLRGQVNSLDTRLTVLEMRVSFIERLLEMMGSPITLGKGKLQQKAEENE